MTQIKNKKAKLCIVFLLIVATVVGVVYIKPYDVAMSEYYMKKYSKTKDVSYAAEGLYYLLGSLTDYSTLEINKLLYCSKVLLDSNQWNTLYYESKIGEKEDYTNKEPELWLKIVYSEMVLTYQPDHYVSEFTTYFSNSSDMEMAAVTSTISTLYGEDFNKKQKEKYYDVIVNGYISLASSQDLESVRTYVYLSEFCSLCGNAEDSEKYLAISEEKRQLFIQERGKRTQGTE